MYGKGAAETLLGEFLSSYQRKDYILATKVYYPMSDTDRGLSRDQIFKQVDASLKRLQTDYIDLYQCHRFDEETSLDETMEAMADIVKLGKVRYIGFSEWSTDQIKAADAVVISTPEYNKGPSGALKNALDWVSRTDGTPWAAKPVAVMSAAAGRAGGERAQMVLRGFMVPFRPHILQGPEIHLAASYEAFDEIGCLMGEMYIQALTALMPALRAVL